MVKLQAPEGAKSCSFNGEEFKVDAKTGLVEVPAEAVADLLNHGFTVPKGK